MWSVFATCLTSGLIMFISLNRRLHPAKNLTAFFGDFKVA